MLEIDDVALWYALNRLMTNYWADVDHNGGQPGARVLFAWALFAVGNNRFEGPEKIRAFYARRRQHGTTTTRHLVGNLRVLRDDAGCVRTVGVMSLYRADGRPPFQWTNRPPWLRTSKPNAYSATTGCGVFSRTSCDRFSSAATFRLRSRSTPNACKAAKMSHASAV